MWKRALIAAVTWFPSDTQQSSCPLNNQMKCWMFDLIVSLQSSRVVSFAPAPTEENGQSDLMSVVKRFGPPLYTLFLPSMVRLVSLFCFCSSGVSSWNVNVLMRSTDVRTEKDKFFSDCDIQMLSHTLQSCWTQIFSYQDTAFSF